MNIDFIKGKIKKINLEIIKSFNNLPPDRNEKSKGYYFRFRRFSKVIFKDGIFKKEVGVNFFQQKKINRFAGGKNRKFLNINKIVLDKIIELIKKNFINYLNPKKNYRIGVHQLRIKCGKNYVGYPVPEGWHKDGFEFVIILNISSSNMKGGTTRLKTNLNLDKKDDFAEFLKSRQFIFINDKKFNHYTDPITIKNEKKISYRDTIVFTVSSFKD